MLTYVIFEHSFELPQLKLLLVSQLLCIRKQGYLSSKLDDYYIPSFWHHSVSPVWAMVIVTHPI